MIALKRIKLGLTNNQLKIIAAICMAFDHIGLILFPNYIIFRIIGRISFPIFAYLIAEGCRHTRNRSKYLGLIAGMGILFQIFYFVFLHDLHQGVLITFSLSIITIFSIESLINNKTSKARFSAALGLIAVVFIGILCPILFGKYGFAIDYSLCGIFLPVLIYFTPKKSLKIIFLSAYLVIMAITLHPIQLWALLSVPLIALYNGKRGKTNMKYFFYIFYPLHIVLIYAIAVIIAILNL